MEQGGGVVDIFLVDVGDGLFGGVLGKTSFFYCFVGFFLVCKCCCFLWGGGRGGGGVFVYFYILFSYLF